MESYSKNFTPESTTPPARPDELNEHFASTAERVTGATPTSLEEIWSLIDRLPDDDVGIFTLTPVSCHQVLHELKSLRLDSSCGPDDIPVKFVKLVANGLAFPLIHIVNTCISQRVFPSAWKMARIGPTPKQAVINENNDLRPISILPVLSKVYERLVISRPRLGIERQRRCI